MAKAKKAPFENTNLNQETFETDARVRLDEEELADLSKDAVENAKTLAEKLVELKTLKDDVKDLKKRQEGFLVDLQEMKHTVRVDAWWQYDFDGNEKVLWGKHRGVDICLERVELTDLDRQLKLGDDRL